MTGNLKQVRIVVDRLEMCDGLYEIGTGSLLWP